MTATTRRIGPPIDPVEGGAARPRWSVMIPAYDCARTLAQTIESVLAEAPPAGQMEVVVVDDASHDDVAGVVERFGGRVKIHRQAVNLGVPENLTACIRLSRGQIVHILHGDDSVRPGFYAAMEHAMSHPEVGAAFCRQVFVDDSGRELGMSALERSDGGILADAAVRLAAEQRVMTPSICVRRVVYEAVGGFHPELRCAEDWEMWVRIASRYDIWYEPRPLAVYRMHPASNTGRNQRTGADLDYTKRAIEIFSAYLPEPRRDELTARALETYARSALWEARKAAERGDIETALAQWRGALRMSRKPRIAWRAAVALFRIALRKVGGPVRSGAPPR